MKTKILILKILLIGLLSPLSNLQASKDATIISEDFFTDVTSYSISTLDETNMSIIDYLCVAQAETIQFAGGGTSRVTCYNSANESYFFIESTSAPLGPDMCIIVTDPAGNFIATAFNFSPIEMVDFNAFGAGAHFIQVIRYDAEISNADELLESFDETGMGVNLTDLEGCFDLSNTLEVIGNLCELGVDCPELLANIGEPCDDGNPDTIFDQINSDCECSGNIIEICEVHAEEISFNGGGTSRETCYNNSEPSYYGLGISTAPIGPDMYIAITDPAGYFIATVLSPAALEMINFNGFGSGAHFIQVVRYEAETSNADELLISYTEEGADVNLSDLDGCADLSNPLEVIGIVCESDFDCHELMVNIGDPCDDLNLLTQNDIINGECGCEGQLISTYDCDELMANYGDFCNDMNPETEYDVISDECECIGLPASDCNVTGGIIEFYNPEYPDAELGVTQNFCATNMDPSYAYVRYVSGSSAPNVYFVVTDDLGNFLDAPTSFGPLNTFDFDQYGTETVIIYTVHFYSQHTNATDLRIEFISGSSVNISDIDGCYSLSNPLEMVGLECEELFDCPEIEANFGDPCDDLNPETENDIINGACDCIGSLPFECDADGATIGFYDLILVPNDLGETLFVCATDGEPSLAYVEFTSFPHGPSMHFVISDELGNYLDIVTSFGPTNTYDFDQYGVGTVYIQAIRYYYEHSNADELRNDFLSNGTSTNLSDIDGCFGISSQIQLVGFECSDLPDCPEMEANFGDPCDDQDENTENDLVNEECECEGEPVFECDAEGATISFYDPEVEASDLGEIIEICANDGVPSNVFVQITVPQIGVNSYYVVTDEFGNYLNVLNSIFNLEVHDFDQYGEGEVYILRVAYYFAYANANDLRIAFVNNGLPTNLSQLEGCFDLSNQIVVTGLDCEELDCPIFEANIGDPCDDMDVNTTNDTIDEECQCAGTVIEDCDVEAIGIIFSDLTYEKTICVTDGIPSTININIVFLPTILDHYFIVHDEAGNFLHIASDTDVIQLMDFDQFGLNTVYVQWVNFDASQSNADELETQFLAAESVPNISDLEGCYALSGELEVEGISCDPDYCPALEASVGDACDDGDPDTDNDIINENCECEGGPLTTFDCPLLEANFDDPCDDGNPATTNDYVGPACECIGIPEEFDCPDQNLNVGDPCDDGNPLTNNDTIDLNCGCVGIPDIFDCTQLLANIGDPCDDGNPLTLNDVVNEICECEGIPEIVVDCPTLGLNVGEPCDDGNPLTFNDSVNENCECEGLPEIVVDCPQWGLNIGDPCDDGDPLTSSDVVDENCDCAGIPEIVICTELGLVVGDECDDGNVFTENDTVNGDCECEGTPILVDCPDLLGNVGDPCPLGDAAGVITEDCDCIPDDGDPCQEWVMYLNDNHDGQTDLYAVDITSGDAVMEYITTIDYQGHIAYNFENDLIYVIHNGNGSYVTVDPHAIVPVVSAPIFLSEDVVNVTTAAFAPNGKLLIGSYTDKVIYSVDVTTNLVSEWDTYAPIDGGDIAFDTDGKLYLATRAGNGFYEVYPEAVMPDQFIANIPSLVTGMALTADGMMITSHNGNSHLQMMGIDGTDAGVDFALMLDGIPFLQQDGDMTSGCVSNQTTEDTCEEFYTFYMHHGPGVEGAKLFNVEFDGIVANLDLMLEVEFPAHIGYDPENQIIFLVNPNGSFIRVYDPVFDDVLGDFPIDGDISNVVAVAYNLEEELLYVGDSNANSIYTIDVATGETTFFANAPVHGGDLVFHNNKLYLATRAGHTLYQIIGGIAVEIASIPVDVNGMAKANNATDLVIANYQSDVFTQINAADGALVSTYNVLVAGAPMTTLNGDFASGCPGDFDTGEGGAGVFFSGSESDANSLTSEIKSYPNPTAGNTEIVFTSGSSGVATVALFDMQGKPGTTLFNAEVKAGQQNKFAFNAGNYSNGLYLINLSINNESVTEKILIAK